jgi:ribosomal protein S18 acetylase RimI-like enzyme
VDGKQLVGVARFVRLVDRTDVAEAALVVVDSEQGKGLGRLLLHRLVAAADERGIERFECSVLASNEPMRNLLESLAQPSPTRISGDVITFDFALPELGVPHQSSLYQLLRLAARGLGLRRVSLFPGGPKRSTKEPWSHQRRI